MAALRGIRFLVLPASSDELGTGLPFMSLPAGSLHEQRAVQGEHGLDGR